VQLVSREYTRFVQENRDLKMAIASTYPVITLLIEKYLPSLAENLIPIVSPTVAIGKVIRERIDPDGRIVFIGPCVAKKVEIGTLRLSLACRRMRILIAL
jgi:iron only hydrogenase large subunit-like protein